MAILNTYHPTLLSLPNRFIFYFLISHKEFHALRVFLVSCVVCYSIRKTRFGSIFPPDPRWGLRNLIRPLGAQVRPQYCHLVLTISIFLNFSLSYTLLDQTLFDGYVRSSGIKQVYKFSSISWRCTCRCLDKNVVVTTFSEERQSQANWGDNLLVVIVKKVGWVIRWARVGISCRTAVVSTI
jgi:hypothetical protein